MTAPATMTLYDDIYSDDGSALANATVTCVLDSTLQTASAGGLIAAKTQTATTNSAGHVSFTVIANDLLTPSGSAYILSVPSIGRTWQAAPQSANGTSQRSTAGNVLVSTPQTLAPAGSLSGLYAGPADLAVRSVTVLSNSPYVLSHLAAALAGTAASVIEGKVWYGEPSGGDDAAGIIAVVAALVTAGFKGALNFWPGTTANPNVYLLGSLVVWPDGIAPLSQGGQKGSSATIFRCTAAGAGFSIGTNGVTGIWVPLCGGFQIDGNAVATTPLLIGKVVGSTFLPISVIGAAAGGSAFLIQKAQNNTFLNPNVESNGADGIVLDLGCGGNVFINAESNANVGWNCRFTQSGASADVYSIPTQNHFINPRFEGGAKAILHESGDRNTVDHPVLSYSAAVAPHTLVQMTLVTAPSADLVLRDPIFNGVQAQTTGLDIANGCSIDLQGQVIAVGLLNFGTLVAGAKVNMDYVPTLASVTNFWVGAGAQDTLVRKRIRAPLEVTRSATSDQLLAGIVSTDAGQRVKFTPVSLLFGDGTAFAYDAGITRNGTARLDITGALKLLSGLYVPTAAKTGTYAVQDADYFVTGDATGGAFTMTLLTAVGRAGKIHAFKRLNSGANAVNIGTTSAQTIDGAAPPYVLAAQWATVVLISDGANWLILDKI